MKLQKYDRETKLYYMDKRKVLIFNSLPEPVR